MKKLVISLMVAGVVVCGKGHFAAAQESVNINGMFCIERSTYKTEDVMDFLAKEIVGIEKEHCDPDKVDGLMRLFSISKIELKNLNHGCPYGHMFEYSLVGSCLVR
jgi:hypothetical protein